MGRLVTGYGAMRKEQRNEAGRNSVRISLPPSPSRSHAGARTVRCGGPGAAGKLPLWVCGCVGRRVGRPGRGGGRTDGDDDEGDEEGLEDGDDGGGEGGDDVLERLELAEEAEHAERAEGADNVDGEAVGVEGEGEEGEGDCEEVENVPSVGEERARAASDGVEEELGGEKRGEERVDGLELLARGRELAAVVVDGFHHLSLCRVDGKVLRRRGWIKRSGERREEKVKVSYHEYEDPDKCLESCRVV